MKIATKIIHEGQQADELTGAIVPPVYLTSTYVQAYPGKTQGYDYTRAGNPNFTNLESTLAIAENGKYATVFASGLSAITALISTLKSGDSVVATDDLYGGTFRIFTRVFSQFGINFKTLNTQKLNEVEDALKQKPKFIFLETPTNPLLNICDIKAIADLAKKYEVKSVVDNTFASPYLQNPLILGVDIVMHSMTKYISGHSDTIGGCLVHNDKELKEKFDFARMAMGLNPSPFDVWLISRGIKTLAVRMQRHCENAAFVAKHLQTHKKVKKIYYPGLSTHHHHDIAQKQMNDFGGMISVEFDMSDEEAKKIVSSFKLFSLAESLGGVESLVEHPASMTHASIPKTVREKTGLGDGLIRFSVGIEDKDDLLNDILSVLK